MTLHILQQRDVLLSQSSLMQLNSFELAAAVFLTHHMYTCTHLRAGEFVRWQCVGHRRTRHVGQRACRTVHSCKL